MAIHADGYIEILRGVDFGKLFQRKPSVYARRPQQVFFTGCSKTSSNKTSHFALVIGFGRKVRDFRLQNYCYFL